MNFAEIMGVVISRPFPSLSAHGPDGNGAPTGRGYGQADDGKGKLVAAYTKDQYLTSRQMESGKTQTSSLKKCSTLWNTDYQRHHQF